MVRFRDQHGRAFFLEVCQDLRQPQRKGRRHPLKGFVEQQYLLAGHQCTRQRHQLLLPP